jgi:hypothetical protein
VRGRRTGRQAVVQPGFRGEGKANRVLIALKRRADLEIPREHRVGRCKHCPEQHGAPKGHSGEAPAEERDGRDGERHGDGQKPDRRVPKPQAAGVVDSQPGGEEHDDHHEFRSAFPDRRIPGRVYPRDDAREQQRRGHPAGHEQRRRRRRSADEEVGQPVRKKQARAQRDQQDVVGVEAETGVFHSIVCTEPGRLCNHPQQIMVAHWGPGSNGHCAVRHHC